VKCEIRIISGAREGHRELLDKPYIGLGRHPMSDVRFDAEKDIDASTRHAAILLENDQYILRDLGSTNGTFVGGERVTTDVVLKDGDVIRCGVHGPELAFHILRDQEEVVMEAVKSGAGAASPAARASTSRPPAPKDKLASTAGSLARETRSPNPEPRAPSKTSVLRAEMAVARQRFRAVTAFLMIVLLGSAAVLIWTNRQSQLRALQAEARADSLNVVLGQMRAAMQEADSTIASYRRQLAAETDPTRRQILQTAMSAAVDRRANIERSIETADEVDYNGIRRRNQPAVAMLWVIYEGDSVPYTGTAFGVSSEGLLLTNKHVVLGQRFDQRPERLAVQFSGSRDVLRARLESVSPNSDIALVRITDAGPFPAVAGLDGDAALVAGAPIAVLGFPGGGGEGDIKTATLVTGSVIETVTDSLLRLDSYSGVGASGSPILDRNGRVVGILFGGERASGGRTVLGLPIRRALSLISR
jgi:S1-C subfamily serine protease